MSSSLHHLTTILNNGEEHDDCIFFFLFAGLISTSDSVRPCNKTHAQ